jgi:antitoxin component YwqK of YwqJK toxin-antitoxin module
VEYDATGQKRSETTYRSDLKHGPYLVYSPSGVVVERGQYVEDKAAGLWTTYFESGKKQAEPRVR